MPVYIRFDGVDGTARAGTANGGVWKTSNFLSADPVNRGAREPGLPGVTVYTDQNSSRTVNPRPQIKTFVCPSDPGVVQISRLSIAGGATAVDGNDPMAKFKVEQLLNVARRRGPNGKLYVATNAGVFLGEGSGRRTVSNNIKQMPLPALNRGTVEIIVTDVSGTVLQTFPLTNVSVSRSDAANTAPQRSRITSLTVTF